MIDIIVLGGGPAGAVAALTLARAGVAVTVIDRDDSGFRIGEGLPPAARPLLNSLGVMERFSVQGHLPSYGNRSVWGSPSAVDTDFIMHPHGHGWHLDRVAFNRGLADAARDAGAAWVRGRAVSFAGAAGAWEVQVAGGGSVRGSFVIDCSGRGSRFARARGVPRKRLDRLVATVALGVDGPPSDGDTLTLVEAAPDGWWYTARIPGRRRVFVYHSDDAVTAPRFESLLGATRHVAPFRVGYTLEAPRPAPAESARLSAASGPGWLAAGDAALSFDPISSQGIVTAMLFGRRAAEAVIAGDFSAYDEAVCACWTGYLRERADCYAMERRFPTPFWQSRQRLEDGAPRA